MVGGAIPETQKLCALHEAVVGVMGHARERNGSSDTHAVLGSCQGKFEGSQLGRCVHDMGGWGLG